MDKTKEYIKQSDCPEIQDGWQPEVGDHVWRKYTVFGEEIDKDIWESDKSAEVIILHFKSDIEGYWGATNSNGEERIFNSAKELHKTTSIWLPRQDQLQKMIWSSSEFSLLDNFRNYVFATNFKDSIPVSMEQLWLAFVMREKYNKVWENGKWYYIED